MRFVDTLHEQSRLGTLLFALGAVPTHRVGIRSFAEDNRTMAPDLRCIGMVSSRKLHKRDAT